MDDCFCLTVVKRIDLVPYSWNRSTSQRLLEKRKGINRAIYDALDDSGAEIRTREGWTPCLGSRRSGSLEKEVWVTRKSLHNRDL